MSRLGSLALAGVMALTWSSGAAQTMVVMGSSLPGGQLGSVKGEPFSLVEKATRVLTLVDGTVITTHYEEHRMRDSGGRTRTETGTITDGKFVVQNVTLMDPVADTVTTMAVSGKTAIVTRFTRTKPTPEQEKTADASAKAEADRKEQPAPPPGYEDLPPETIAGVYATGRRHSQVIPAGRIGNDRDIHIVEETWSSPELKSRMRSITDDPRYGKTTVEVTELKRSEPDPALFRIPADYKVTERVQ